MTVASRIRIPAPLMTSIANDAEAAYPNECCGLLVGGGAGGGLVVTRVAPSPNVTEGDPRASFLVDAQLQFDLMRELASGPERIVGHYHSHPDHPPRPSDHDRECAFYADHVWVIVAVSDGRAGDATAYVVDEAAGGFREIALAR